MVYFTSPHLFGGAGYVHEMSFCVAVEYFHCSPGQCFWVTGGCNAPCCSVTEAIQQHTASSYLSEISNLFNVLDK